jgi:lysophospholipase L1-like esterase
MKNFFFSLLKIVLLNLSIVIFFIAILELFFGYWFDKNNFGPYMREHRMKKQNIVWKYKDELVEYNYQRNYYGFRAEDMDPSKIDAIILGGSVIDERYKPHQYTITGYLNENLKKNSANIKIINAGVEGQSTKGIISGFENWLFKIKKFKPKFILIYTGINDQTVGTDNVLKLETDGHLLNPDKFEVFKDNFKSRSIIYDKLRIFKYKFLSSKKNFVRYNGKIDDSYKNNFNFISYNKANISVILDKNKKNSYLKRIDIIYKYSRKLGAEPIFITNITASGYSKNIFLLNKSLIEHCKLKKYLCIDLAKKIDGKVEYWYDGVHTTKEGSKVIADLVTPELLNFFKN